MPTWLRRIFSLAPLILVAALNVAHPMVRSPIYGGMVHQVDWWICLHLLNVVGFPLVGLAVAAAAIEALASLDLAYPKFDELNFKELAAPKNKLLNK
jgi:hypothetical protein